MSSEGTEDSQAVNPQIYAPPVVEDLDTTYGTATTPAVATGSGGTPGAAPRELF